MKKALVTLEIPLPDEATQEEADALAGQAEHKGVTDDPTGPVMLDSAPYGRVVRTRLLDAAAPLPEDRLLDALERLDHLLAAPGGLAGWEVQQEGRRITRALLAEHGRGGPA